MKKITLDLDDLQVESFETAPESGDGRGTVFGYAPTVFGTCNCTAGSLTCDTCTACNGGFTCEGTCETCWATCGVAQTGDGDSCDGSCTYTCNPFSCRP